MCGIIGYAGPRNAEEVLLDGLKRLEYRGYDSAGLAIKGSGLEVFKEVGEIKPEYEKVGYYGRVIFWSAPVETFSRTRWSKIVGSSVYGSITIRNANTINKILKLCGK
jgi:glutamate synthase domain-containing protein 1